MRIAYPVVIQEDAAALAALERRRRGRPAAPRVRMLRLLKDGTAPALRACAPLVGYSLRQLSRWWATYREGGLAALAALAAVKRRPGKASRVTPEAWAGLEGELRAGRIAPLADARRYLAERWGVEYGSLNGVWCLLRRRRVTLKTGRRRHRRADAAAQDGFKKTSAPPSPSGAPRRRSPSTKAGSG
jgi:transposase